MMAAYQAVKKDNEPVKRAALIYGVPETTLRQRVLGRVAPETSTSGPSPELNEAEEAIFVEHLKSMAKLGYGYITSEVLSMASNYAVHLGKRDEMHPFGVKWHRCFIKRWPELSSTKPKALANYKACATSESALSEYFQRLDRALTQFDLKNKPHYIYNVAEKCIHTEQLPSDIVSADTSTPAITTILGCGNALGTKIPPFYIFQGKSFCGDLLKGSSVGSQGIVTGSGYSNSAAFQEFLKSHFLKYVQRGNDDQIVLLILDGHKCHVNVPVLEWAETHNIELFVLPAHTSHLLQPLDVVCFGPLQNIYDNECHKFIHSSPYSSISNNVAKLLSEAYEHALSVPNIKSAFRRTGIYPLNPFIIETVKETPATANEQSSSSSISVATPVLSGLLASFCTEQSSFGSHQAKKYLNT